ncbi:hypothetical protein [Companilactobacillus zhachilii]|nr:hypothetical protein [Companilactobacillus zhachilii]
MIFRSLRPSKEPYTALGSGYTGLGYSIKDNKIVFNSDLYLLGML